MSVRYAQRSSEKRARIRARLIRQHGPFCWICDERIDVSLPVLHDEALTIDHVVPLSRGGTWRLENLRPAHRCCNEARANPRVERRAAA